MPPIKNPKQLDAALERRGISPHSEAEIKYATGWRDRGQNKPNLSPYGPTIDPTELYEAGWDDATVALLRPELEQTPPDARPVVPPFARFELARAALTGYRASMVSEGQRAVLNPHEMATACWRDADAVLAAMDDKEKL